MLLREGRPIRRRAGSIIHRQCKNNGLTLVNDLKDFLESAQFQDYKAFNVPHIQIAQRLIEKPFISQKQECIPYYHLTNTKSHRKTQLSTQETIKITKKNPNRNFGQNPKAEDNRKSQNRVLKKTNKKDEKIQIQPQESKKKILRRFSLEFSIVQKQQNKYFELQYRNKTIQKYLQNKENNEALTKSTYTSINRSKENHRISDIFSAKPQEKSRCWSRQQKKQYGPWQISQFNAFD